MSLSYVVATDLSIRARDRYARRTNQHPTGTKTPESIIGCPFKARRKQFERARARRSAGETLRSTISGDSIQKQFALQ